MCGTSQLASFFKRFFPADNPVRRLKLLAGSLFVLAGLTLFLTYLRIEYPPSDPFVDLTPSSIESFTGVQLMTGSYHSKSSHDAEDASWSAYLVASAALLGLATLPSRRNKAAAIALFIALIITLMGGCASTLDLDLFGGPETKSGYGFVLGVLLLAGATALRVYLWLTERRRVTRIEPS
jgi:hypothetical protein